jgi:cysteine sulfinate desulfinase/cysteine desulfurase-like protein
LEVRGILAATASPCADQAGLPSASLVAVGFSEEEARRAIVFCIPPTATLEEESLRLAAEAVREEALRLRALTGGVAGPSG